MTKLRHFLLLLALAFSFGGFTFYASVVVPIGGEVLGKSTQGFVTRRVTHVVNASMAITAAILAWEIIAGWPDRSRRINVLLTICTALAGACCVALVMLHPRIDSFLIDVDQAVTDYEVFYGLHRLYLWISTVQWLATLPVLWVVANGPHKVA